jgi:phosphoglycerate dehydrogenase-like enzyme
VVSRKSLKDAAAEADFLIVLAPYSPETHRLVDRSVLGALKREAVLINIARGKVIDESALIEALREKRIAGAALDVFETEPLPPESPLWGMDNVIITPRIGGMSDIYAEQASAIMLRNIRAFAAGKLDEVINKVAF